jgi:hypothetical protein
LVNIIGGNIKGMLVKYHFLSLPSVSELHMGHGAPVGALLCELFFRCEEGGLKLSLYKME